MIADDKENFVSRWSRRKIEARKAEEKPAEPAPSPAAVPVASSANATATQPAAPAPVELPPLESLKGLASEYRDFMRPGVDENLKRSALKQLFRDPHFENFERFAEYCEDYTQGEPIPMAMLKTLEHAKGLLFEEEKKEEKPAVAGKQEVALPEKTAQAPAPAKTESPAAPAEPKEKA